MSTRCLEASKVTSTGAECLNKKTDLIDFDVHILRVLYTEDLIFFHLF